VLAALGTSGVEVQAQLSLWLTLIGSVLAVAGGFVDLAWVRRKRVAGDAIDPDTLTASAAEATSEPEAGSAPDV
jgi:hypothetical protein